MPLQFSFMVIGLAYFGVFLHLVKDLRGCFSGFEHFQDGVYLNATSQRETVKEHFCVCSPALLK